MVYIKWLIAIHTIWSQYPAQPYNFILTQPSPRRQTKLTSSRHYIKEKLVTSRHYINETYNITTLHRNNKLSSTTQQIRHIHCSHQQHSQTSLLQEIPPTIHPCETTLLREVRVHLRWLRCNHHQTLNQYKLVHHPKLNP